ncbi:MAG: HNH endonuclease [Methanobrevibacter sp.]|nr:HNH endonuclease [Methanobrevibacter sp.]
MFETYFELIENPISKQIETLTEENQKQEKRIEKYLIKTNKTISQIKKENKNIKLENRSLVKERDSFKVKYNNLRNIVNQLKFKNKAPVPKLTKRDVFERDNYTCLACGNTKNLTIDHIKPRVMGGTNDINNLQILCKHCNLAKGVSVIDYRTNNVEPLIKRKKETPNYNWFNFSVFDTLDIKV